MSAPFILRADGHMHTSDVRCVALSYLDTASSGNGGTTAAAAAALEQSAIAEAAHLYRDEAGVRIVTASRDSTAALSTIPSKATVLSVEEEGTTTTTVEGDEHDEIYAQQLLVGHGAFVNFSLIHKEGLHFLDSRPTDDDDNSNGNEEQQTPSPTRERSGKGTYVITGSNDNHILIWSLAPQRIEAVLDGHSGGVTCGAVVCVHPSQFPGFADDDDGSVASNPADPRSYHGDIVTGDWSGRLLVFSHRTGKVKVTYSGHQVAIRGVVHLPSTTICVSVSGDKTAHCWDIAKVARQAANALAVTGPVARVLQGHEDVIQCVCYIGSNSNGSAASFLSYFATGSNDCTVRVWAVENHLKEAHPVRTLHGHDSLVYSLCASAFSGEIFSASEDRTVRVWGAPANKNEEETAATASTVKPICGDGFFDGFATTHVVQHPCVVWSVAVCRVHHNSNSTSDEAPYEDLLATGGSDNVLRLWTRNDAHFASVEKLEKLEAAIAVQTVDVRLLSGGNSGSNGNPLLDMATMATVEELHTFQGSAEGEKKFVKNESHEIEVYIWTRGRWDKIGVVVSENKPVNVSSTGEVLDSATGAPKQREKKLYQGQEYDYLFDVDIDGRMLQLPYIVGQSLYDAAQRFIDDNSTVAADTSLGGSAPLVAQDHKEQIVAFLLQNLDAADVRRVPGLGGDSGNNNGSSSPGSGAAAAAGPVPSSWDTAELLEAFSANGAQTKASEFLALSAPDKAAGLSTVMAEVQALGSGGSDPAAVALLAARLAELFAALPSDKKFPAIDAVRFAVAQVPQYAGEFLLALRPHIYINGGSGGGGGGFTYMPATDSDTLVMVRLASNVLPALMTTPALSVDVVAAGPFAREFLAWAAADLAVGRAVPVAAAAGGNANVRQALAAFFLRNLSVLTAVVLSSGACAGHEGLQALQAVRLNTGADNLAVLTGQLLPGLVTGLLAAVAALLPADATTAPLLLRSLATVAAEANGSSGGGSVVAATAAAFKSGVAAIADAAPAAVQPQIRQIISAYKL